MPDAAAAPVTRYYAFDEIARLADCVQIAREIGLAVNGDNRCAATWRGGTNETSVSLAATGWHDFAVGESGGAVDLVALVNFGGDRQRAQQWLGDRLALTPAMQVGSDRGNRAERLERDGYALVKTYDYIDPDTGKTRHTVERWQHPEKGKEFVQRVGSRCSVKGIETLLYRLPEWHKSRYVVICEGEKDADTVADRLGFRATTNPAGAGNWADHYNRWLVGKDAVILADNDAAGQKRLAYLLWALKDVCGRLKAVTFEELAEGGDITDFVEAHGIEAGKAKITSAAEVDKAAICKPSEDMPAIAAAKEANRYDLKNYLVQDGEDDKGKPKKVHVPRQVNDLCREIRTRLLGFPHRLGDSLFDHGRDGEGIHLLTTPAELFAWIATKTKHNVQWKRGEGYTPKDELFASLRLTARRYETASNTPHHPARADTYYSHPPLPPPSQDREVLATFIKFFAPASPVHEILLRTFVAAPLFYLPGIPRPAWIIDSEDGAGTGKTTLVEAVATLYGGEPIRTSKAEIVYTPQEVLKRMISAGGRMRRLVLVDNVQGNFASAHYSDWVTGGSLSGRPAYGRGEETRANDLTYTLTANSANVDNDIACRSWTIQLKRGDIRPNWKSSLVGYTEANRLQILADIIDTLKSNEPFEVATSTRYPEFEQQVLQAMCGDLGEYSEAIKTISADQQTANLEEDVAARIGETIRHNLMNIGLAPDMDSYFIRTEVIDAWFRNVPMPVDGDIKQQIVNAAKHGMLPEVDKTIRRWPHHGKERRRGFLWNRLASAPHIIGIDQSGRVGVIL
jgi:hypothetical protein